MEMARDAIGLMGIDMEDEGRHLPEPNSKEQNVEAGDTVTLVDVDFVEYRKKVDNKAVKKNCTIPYWMSVELIKLELTTREYYRMQFLIYLELQKQRNAN